MRTARNVPVTLKMICSLLLLLYPSLSDSQDEAERARKREETFDGRTAWQMDEKLGEKWRELTGRFIFQRSCLPCHPRGPAAYPRTKWQETLETFPDDTHKDLLPEEYKDLTAMFSYGSMMPNNLARTRALRTFLQRYATAEDSATDSLKAVDLLPRVGNAAPPFSIVDVDGVTHDLDVYAQKGESLILVFSRAHW